MVILLCYSLIHFLSVHLNHGKKKGNYSLVNNYNKIIKIDENNVITFVHLFSFSAENINLLNLYISFSL
jgi:hypothetical protein